MLGSIFGTVLTFVLRNPMGQALGVLLALTIWTVYQRQDAASDAESLCQQEQFEAQVAEKERQLAVAEEIAQDARRRADSAEAEMLTLREAANEVLEESGPSCDIPDDLRQRLRDIR